MIERIQQNETGPFQKGGLVKLREDLDAKVIEVLKSKFKQGEVYKIFYVDYHDDEGGDTVWIGSYDSSEQDVLDFHPEIAQESRYKKTVFPVALRHLKPAVN